MTDRHLTEEDLQVYVVDRAILPAATLAHVTTCRHCQEEIETYQLVISVIKEQPAFQFNIDLSAIVLEKIQPEKEKKLKNLMIPITTIVLVLVPIYFFRKNFFYFFAGISEFTLVVCAFLFGCVLVIKALQLYNNYRKQLEKINFLK